MSNELLREAIALIKAGETQKGKAILISILKTDQNNELAWLWLSACVDTEKQKIDCLQNVLKINPENLRAKQALIKLTTPQPPVEAPEINDILSEKTKKPSIPANTARIAKSERKKSSTTPFMQAKPSSPIWIIGGVGMLLLGVVLVVFVIGLLTNNPVLAKLNPITPCNQSILESVLSTHPRKIFQEEDLRKAGESVINVQANLDHANLKDLQWKIEPLQEEKSCSVFLTSTLNGKEIIGPVFYVDLERKTISADDQWSRIVFILAQNDVNDDGSLSIGN